MQDLGRLMRQYIYAPSPDDMRETVRGVSRDGERIRELERQRLAEERVRALRRVQPIMGRFYAERTTTVCVRNVTAVMGDVLREAGFSVDGPDYDDDWDDMTIVSVPPPTKDE